MLFNGRALIFTFSRTQVRFAEIERLQSLFKMSMHPVNEKCSIRVIQKICAKASQMTFGHIFCKYHIDIHQQIDGILGLSMCGSYPQSFKEGIT